MALFGRKKVKTPDQPVAKTGLVDSEKKEIAKKSATSAAKLKMKDLYSGVKPTEVVSKDTAKKEKVARKYQEAYRILIKPLVTEKVTNLGVLNQYVFAVASKANKIEVARAVKAVYGVKPVKVNMIKMLGKKAGYGRISGKRKDWKKAIVTLSAGQTIKVYEGV